MTDFIYRKIQSVPRKYHSATCCSYYLNYCFSIHAVVAVVTIPHVSVTIVCLQNQITHINSHPDRCSSVPKQFCCIKINRYNLSNEKINIDIFFVFCKLLTLGFCPSSAYSLHEGRFLFRVWKQKSRHGIRIQFEKGNCVIN